MNCITVTNLQNYLRVRIRIRNVYARGFSAATQYMYTHSGRVWIKFANGFRTDIIHHPHTERDLSSRGAYGHISVGRLWNRIDRVRKIWNFGRKYGQFTCMNVCEQNINLPERKRKKWFLFLFCFHDNKLGNTAFGWAVDDVFFFISAHRMSAISILKQLLRLNWNDTCTLWK